MLPYCSSESTQWDCIRGCVLGFVNLGAFLVIARALSRVAVIYQRTRWHGLNLAMLGLAASQSMFAFAKYIILRSPRLSMTISFSRALQSLLTCSVYGKVACETSGRPELFRKRLVPILGFIVLYLTIILIITAVEDEVPCHHPNWLLLSSSQLLVNGIFAVSGLFVMKELSRDPNNSAELLARSEREAAAREFNFGDDGIEPDLGHDLSMQGEMRLKKQQRHQLWVLLFVNTFSGLVQLCLDSWLQSLHLQGESCSILDSDFEELLRLILKLCAYDLPVAATYYVFYWMRRVSFDPRMDINLQDVLLDNSDLYASGSPRPAEAGSTTIQPGQLLQQEGRIQLESDQDISDQVMTQY